MPGLKLSVLLLATLSNVVLLLSGANGASINIRQDASNASGLDSETVNRRNAVRDAMKHAWSGYQKYAYDNDELLPLSKKGSNKWGGWKITLVDALDTLYIMGLTDEFEDAKRHAYDIDFSKSTLDNNNSFFEMTIRGVAGLVSASELSGDKKLLEKAKELADVLQVAYDTPTKIPARMISVNGKKPTSGARSSIAESGSCVMEYSKLSQLTGNQDYFNKAQDSFFKIINMTTPAPGLYPRYIDINTGKPVGGSITMGAEGDSFYEYMLKYHLLDSKANGLYKQAYTKSIDSAKSKLFKPNPANSDEYFVGQLAADSYTSLDTTFEHLACFVPGMLALGAKDLNRQDDLDIAKKILNTCYQMYKSTPTGLSPESIIFDQPSPNAKRSGNMLKRQNSRGFTNAKNEYILRPETVESLFVLHRLTGDQKYRDQGWEIFQALEKYTKTPDAYACYRDVTNTNPQNNWEDRLDSYFYAEMFKYLYLLFSPDDLISFDEYVFNTEAHPFRKF